jgi:DNA mismatch repair protein MutH
MQDQPDKMGLEELENYYKDPRNRLQPKGNCIEITSREFKNKNKKVNSVGEPQEDFVTLNILISNDTLWEASHDKHKGKVTIFLDNLKQIEEELFLAHSQVRTLLRLQAEEDSKWNS